MRVCIKLKKKWKHRNKLPGEVGDSVKNRSRQTSVRRYRRLFDPVSELGKRLSGVVGSFPALRDHRYTHIYVRVCVGVYIYVCVYIYICISKLSVTSSWPP